LEVSEEEEGDEEGKTGDEINILLDVGSSVLVFPLFVFVGLPNFLSSILFFFPPFYSLPCVC